MKKTVLTLLFTLSLCISCNKDDDAPSPPITAENTFSCKISGENFVPEEHGAFPNTIDGIIITQIDDSNSWQFILGNGEKDIYIYLYDVTSTGTYTLRESDGDSDFFGETKNVVEFSENGNQISTHKSINTSGFIEVLELEKNNKIILEFDEVTLIGNEDPNDTVTLTNGKLNINLETLNQKPL